MSSAPLLSSPTPSPATTTAARRLRRRGSMATCVESCPPKSPIPIHIDDALYHQYINCAKFHLPDRGTAASTTADEDLLSEPDPIWAEIQAEARSDVHDEPILRAFYDDLVLRHPTLESALSRHLANKLAVPNLIPTLSLHDLFHSVILDDPSVPRAARADLRAARDRDPACSKMVHCFLYYKGFLACQAHRVAHRLWATGRWPAALLIQSRVSEVFAVDIHPGARIGSGVLLDHATGVVIGETAVVGDNVSILHGVTLGGTGKEAGDRHPKIEDGVLVGSGAQILGCVSIGSGAKIGAGSVVLKPVPARTTAVGNPARLLGGKENPVRLRGVAGLTMDHTSWSDYVI